MHSLWKGVRQIWNHEVQCHRIHVCVTTRTILVLTGLKSLMLTSVVWRDTSRRTSTEPYWLPNGWLGFQPSQPASYHIGCQIAGPARQLVTILAGWAFGPSKCGCQNLKVAGHMCPACPRFSSPDHMVGFWCSVAALVLFYGYWLSCGQGLRIADTLDTCVQPLLNFGSQYDNL